MEKDLIGFKNEIIIWYECRFGIYGRDIFRCKMIKKKI